MIEKTLKEIEELQLTSGIHPVKETKIFEDA